MKPRHAVESFGLNGRNRGVARIVALTVAITGSASGALAQPTPDAPEDELQSPPEAAAQAADRGEPSAPEPPSIAPERVAEAAEGLGESTDSEGQEEAVPANELGSDGVAFGGLSLEELLNISVVSASRRRQLLIDAPATMMVITAQDIRDRGYTSLAEVVMDLPGFDISLSNGSTYMNAYQRGYRTPYTQRTLLLINGRVDNHLWRHTAEISRQYPLSNIDRVEVVYGPASAVYGPNAFLGLINVITRDASDLADGQVSTRAEVQAGSWSSYGVDAAVNARAGDLRVSLSGRFFRSDEADLSRRWGWLSNTRYGDPQNWGSLVDRTQLEDGTFIAGLHPDQGTPLPGISNAGRRLGTYYDPTDDYGVIGEVSYRGLSLGVVSWRIREGYGAQYTADHVQSNMFWNKSSLQVYAQYEAETDAGVRSTTLLMYRQSNVWGDWAEAEPDWHAGMEAQSYVSLTPWNADNDSYLFRQLFEYGLLDDHLVLNAGFNVERKDLTRAYDVSGYWEGSFSSAVPSTNLGPEGYGAGIVHTSSADSYVLSPPPAGRVPEANRILTTDVGGFFEANGIVGQARFVGGVRFDRNSLYGSSVNPRAAIIYHLLDHRAAVRAVFGTAFQEPAPQQLFGGWNGRRANPDLSPERVRNLDVGYMMQLGPVYLDVAGFYARYTNVIKEEAENAGSRDIVGGELKLRLDVPNPIPRSSDLRIWVNASTTFAYSSIHYDFTERDWVDGTRRLGDIAPFKMNFGITVPILGWATFTVRGNAASSRELYLRNALRDPTRPDGGRTLDGYLTLDAYLRAHYESFYVGFLTRNLLDARYFHPGIEQADSGDSFSANPAVRSGGYRNSLIPQPGRSFMVTVGIDY